VLYLGRYWDSEGDHPLERITEYARLDVEDEEYATWYGTGWNTATATTVRVAEYPDGIALGSDKIADYDRFANALFGALMELTDPARAHLVNPLDSCSDTKPRHRRNASRFRFRMTEV
jgi:hypothetical protein